MTVMDQAAGLRRLLERGRARAEEVLSVEIEGQLPALARKPDRTCEGREIVLVVSPDSASIIAAYAAIKRARRERADQAFALLVTGVKAEHDALAIHRNIADAAQRFLATRVELMGYIDQQSFAPTAAARRAKGEHHAAR